ncbi:MAG: DNA-3-methyladenine glycosylase 2 family protein [Burkholderiales bacterium]|nr:DNA-3-methyladenine glycosylase 2 family protein [Burkholderiales bacterium]
MLTPPWWEEAKSGLAARDPVLAGIISKHPGVSLRRTSDPFSTLARSIVGQQISVKAAETVWGRFVGLLGEVTPGAVLCCEELRSCGLSARKAEYLKDLAQHFDGGRFDGWDRLPDEDLIRLLTTVRGIGRWTAEMFLIFQALRPDVLPLDDIGLQRAIRLHYGEMLGRAEMKEIAGIWSPWRSVATWYLWRSLDPVPVEY